MTIVSSIDEDHEEGRYAQNMAWSDLIEWNETIQRHRDTNTPLGLFKTMFRVCASQPIYVIRHIEPHVNIEDIGEKSFRIRTMIHLCLRCIENKSFESKRLYRIITGFLESLKKERIHTTLVLKIQESIRVFIGTECPKWHILDTVLPAHYYANSCYSADVSAYRLAIANEVPIFNDLDVATYTAFENGDEYRNLLQRISEKRTFEDMTAVNAYLSNVHESNISHIGMREWMYLVRSLGFDSIHDGIRGIPELTVSHIIKSNTHIDDVLAIVSEQKHFKRNQIAEDFGRRKKLTLKSFHKVTRQHWWTEDMTLECLYSIMHTPHRKVFRTFMDHYPDWDDVLHYIETGKDWLRFCIRFSRRAGLKMHDIIRCMDCIDWDWEELSQNPDIATPENIQTYPHLPWVWGKWGISMSSAITEDFIRSHHEMGINFGNSHAEWGGDRGTLSANHAVVTPNLIDAFPDKDWSYTYDCLSTNTNITLPWYIDHINREWDLSGVFSHVSVDINLAARAIQCFMRIHTKRRKAKKLATDVVEWWYSPYCKPAQRVRNVSFEQYNSLV